MNKIKRWLAIALCLCTLCTSGIGELSLALAEEAGQTVVLETEAPVKTEAPVETEAPVKTEAPVETEVPATAIPEIADATEVPAETQPPVEPTGTEPVKPEVDFTRDATYSPSFAFGYAEIEKTARLYPDERGREEALGEIASGEFVLCVDRDGEDWLKVVFAFGEETVSGWIAPDALRPISESEASIRKITDP